MCVCTSRSRAPVVCCLAPCYAPALRCLSLAIENFVAGPRIPKTAFELYSNGQNKLAVWNKEFQTHQTKASFQPERSEDLLPVPCPNSTTEKPYDLFFMDL